MPLSITPATTVEVTGGRTTTLQTDNFDTAQSITVIDAPDHGRLTVNPDNSLSLVMTQSDYNGPMDFTIEVTDENGNTSQQTITMNVVAGQQAAGWATGSDHYMLETDDAGELVVETGQNHREVYVSGSADALSVADIAAAEGLQTWQINAQWLADNPQYGSSPETALDYDTAMMLWGELVGGDAEPSSHWLRFEAGYTYQTRGEDISTRGIQGESPLHPVVITSYGEGEQPIIRGDMYFIANDFSNIVVRDLHFTDTVTVAGPGNNSHNVIFDSVTGTEEGAMVAQNVDGFTLRDSNFYNLNPREPIYGDTWHPFDDRIQGIYAQGGDGLLIEGTRFTEIGWDDGYSYDRSGDNPQAPGMFSHAVYVQNDNTDVTFRDNIMGQASSFGAQIRTGGFVEDNLFFDNNAMLNVLGGGEAGAVGHYSLVQGNVVTDAGYRDAVTAGALSLGIDNQAYQTALIGNIVAHLTDPEAPWELDSHFYNNGGLNNPNGAFFDDTIVYNWFSGEDVLYDREDTREQNVDGLDRAVLDQTTMNNLARLMLNDASATTDDLIQWIQQNEVTADQLNAFFQSAFGLGTGVRTDARDVRFVPDERGDGVRWDNRINWDTGDIAGTVAGDRVDLGGNLVIYGGTNTIASLDFGDNGRLEAYHGRLTVTGRSTSDTTGGEIAISNAGQVWLGGYVGGGRLSVFQDGGRFANTGIIHGSVSVFVDSGQAVLSADGGLFTVGSNQDLLIHGGDALVGFDDDNGDLGIIRFRVGADIIFASDETGLGQISEFRSGAFGPQSNVNSRIELGDADLRVDLSQAFVANGSYLLLSADEITGNFRSFDVDALGGRGATITVNYETDEVWLELGSGSGTTIQTIGTDNGPGPDPEPQPNAAPEDITLSSLVVAEGTAGAVVGQVSVYDPDAGDTHTFTVSDNRFQIVDGQLQLRQGVTLNYDDAATINVDIVATDTAGASVTETFTIQVTDTPDPVTPPTGVFSARYLSANSSQFSLGEIDWTAPALHQETLSGIDFTNSAGSFWDGGRVDYFAVQITGTITVPQDGSFNFHLSADDGAALYIDGQLVVNHDGLHGYTTASGAIDLAPGSHEIEVRYFEYNGYAGLRLEWDGPGIDGVQLVEPGSPAAPGKNPLTSFEPPIMDVTETGGDAVATPSIADVEIVPSVADVEQPPRPATVVDPAPIADVEGGRQPMTTPEAPVSDIEKGGTPGLVIDAPVSDDELIFEPALTKAPLAEFDPRVAFEKAAFDTPDVDKVEKYMAKFDMVDTFDFHDDCLL